MGTKLDLMGKRFGRLLVLEESNQRVRNSVTWVCLCDCGNKTRGSTGDLRDGGKKSCGCLHTEHSKYIGLRNRVSKGENGLNSLFGNYKNRSKKLNIPFELDIKIFKKLTSSPCKYCSTSPKQINQGTSRTLDGARHARYLYNGLDKVNPKLGYTLENVVPCCKVCNYAKRLMSVTEFKDWVFRAYHTLFDDKLNI